MLKERYLRECAQTVEGAAWTHFAQLRYLGATALTQRDSHTPVEPSSLAGSVECA
jgi:hypothetical protein